MSEEQRKRADLLWSALKALPGFGHPTHLESWEMWTEPGTQVDHQFVLLERPEDSPIAYFRTESRTLSVDMARAVATILDLLPEFLASLESDDRPKI